MQTTSHCVVSWRRCCFLVVAGAVALLAGPIGRAAAQQPDGEFEGEHSFKQADGQVVPITESKAAKSKIFALLRSGKATSSEDEKHFNDFFRFHLTEMTWKENIPALPRMRADMKRKYLGQAGRAASPDLHAQLNKWILDDFQKIAKDVRYPRAVRYNAVLLIGELDQREEAIGSGPPAVPMPDAEPVLFGIFKNEDEHNALRIGAMIGLQRHAAANLPADQRTELVGAMTKLLQAKEPPKGKGLVGHQWMRMLACHILGTLAEKGPEANQPQVVDALQTLIADKSAELWLRCDAAGQLGLLQSKAAPQDKVLPLAQQLADLAVEAAQTNDRLMAAAGLAEKKEKPAAKPALDKLDKKEKKADADEEEAEEPAAPAIPETVLKLAAEDVADQLVRVHFGLTGQDLSDRSSKPSPDHGLLAAGDQAAQTFIKDVVSRIDSMLKCLKDKKELHEQLANVSSVGNEMQTWLKQSGAGVEQQPEKPKVAAPAPAKPSPASGTTPPPGNAGAADSAVGSP